MKILLTVIVASLTLGACTGHYAARPTSQYYYPAQATHIWVDEPIQYVQPRVQYVQRPTYHYNHRKTKSVNHVSVNNSYVNHTTHHRQNVVAPTPAPVYVAPAAPAYSQEDRDMQQAIANSYQTYAGEQAARAGGVAQ